MGPHLIVPPSRDEGQELHDGTVVSETTSQLLGSSSGGGADAFYDRITLALSEYGAWKDHFIDGAIVKLEDGMAQALRDNTCPNRPKCGDGTHDCEHELRSCREGYVQFVNSYDVPCCRFDPPAAGFPYEDVAKMFAAEIAWCFFIDPGGISFAAKSCRYLATKMGGSALKAGRSIGVVARFSTKASGAITRANLVISKKVASTVGFKAGSRIGGQLAAKMGLKLGVKVGTRLATAAGATLIKGLGKLTAFGPVGMAMLAFDLISMALDLWDPAGYNNAQAAGQIKTMRDNLLEQYNQSLAEDGIKHPIVSDVLYDMAPDEQSEYIENLVIDWYTGKLAEFLSANEQRWEVMPLSETVAEYENEASRLEGVLGGVNFLPELIHKNTENTFLLRASKVAGTPQSVVGTNKDQDYDRASQTHLMVCSLNATGVVAFNSFAIQKAKFINAIASDPIYRWMKINNGYRVYEAVPPEVLESLKFNPSAKKSVGWAFTKVDPEEEFFMQYRHAKEEGIRGTPPREKYMDAWDKDARNREAAYELSIKAVMEENLVTYAPPGVTAASVEMVRNQTTESPAWYPSYEELYTEAKGMIDLNIQEIAEEERLALVASETALKNASDSTDKKVSKSNGISVPEARRMRREAEQKAAREPLQPDFAVFKDGFAQSSPLLYIKQECDNMGHGNHFLPKKGLCEFTSAYCKRYGLTYFYNKDVGTHDCMLSNVQKGFETVFGTTITRGIKGLFGAEGPHPPPLRIKSSQAPVFLGACGNSVAGASASAWSPHGTSAFETAVALDKLGLGAKYSVWN